VNGYLSAEKNGLTFFIEENADGVFLYSIPLSGFFSDTWHLSVEDAKAQAAFAAQSAVGPWRSVSQEVGDQFISDKMKAFNSK
jgi:hypothetical protein